MRNKKETIKEGFDFINEMKAAKRNILIESGEYFLFNKVIEDKSIYTRKEKHKNKDDEWFVAAAIYCKPIIKTITYNSKQLWKVLQKSVIIET